jgi:hypothetical protein
MIQYFRNKKGSTVLAIIFQLACLDHEKQGGRVLRSKGNGKIGTEEKAV